MEKEHYAFFTESRLTLSMLSIITPTAPTFRLNC